MTRSANEVQLLLERLAADAPLERDGVEESERRQRIAHAIDDRLDRLAATRARRVRRVFAAGLAAAFTAGAAAAWVVLRPPSTENVVATVTSDRPALLRHQGVSQTTSSTRLEASDELSTPSDTTATAILTNGARVEIDPDSTVRFDAHADSTENAGQDLRLTHGTVALRVPKLGPHRTLSVVTPDARVTVRGTRFSVSVLGADDRRETRVHVTEGSVWVDHAGTEDVLSAGQSWSSRPEPTTAVAPQAPTAAPQAPTAAPQNEPPIAPSPATTPSSKRASSPSTSASSTATASSLTSASSSSTATAATTGTENADPNAAHHDAAAESTLAAENASYQRAVVSVRSGDDARAVGLLETFLSSFPRSLLAQNAEVERLRALTRLGRHDAATRAAQHYLSAYPRGFASEEARRLLAATRAP